MVRSIKFLEAGHTEQLEKFVNPLTGKWRKIRFPSTVAVIEHETAGIILYDTGYSPRFFEQTKYFPEKVYALITPVQIPPEETAIEKIKRLGLKPDDVSHVVISHFHADHIAGAGDFDRAKYIYSQHELNYFKSLPRLLQVKNGFIGGLLPSDFEFRGLPADEYPISLPELGAGWKGKDLFGDESVFAVPLPGHTLGQIGLYVRDVKGKDYLLVADAAWVTPSYEKNILPMRVAQEVFFHREEYRQTLARIHETYCKHLQDGKLQIVTCHCDVAFQNGLGTHV
jgi:glyoxylase-like metal-dependent hydrolase (beta-lactamase superfamily II)